MALGLGSRDVVNTKQPRPNGRAVLIHAALGLIVAAEEPLKAHAPKYPHERLACPTALLLVVTSRVIFAHSNTTVVPRIRPLARKATGQAHVAARAGRRVFAAAAPRRASSRVGGEFALVVKTGIVHATGARWGASARWQRAAGPIVATVRASGTVGVNAARWRCRHARFTSVRRAFGFGRDAET